MAPRRLSFVALAAVLGAALAFWLSAGTLTVANVDPGAPRIALLASPAARAVARRGGRGVRVSRRGVAGLPAFACRRRTSLPRHHAEPVERSRSQNRKQPSPGRLPRVLQRRAQAGLPAPRARSGDLLDSRPWTACDRRAGVCAVWLSGRRGAARARERLRD